MAGRRLSPQAGHQLTSAQNQHGGQESTILALNNVFYHWGCVIVPPGYTDTVLFNAGGNPYGTPWGGAGGTPSEHVLAAARYQGQLVSPIAGRLASSSEQQELPAVGDVSARSGALLVGHQGRQMSEGSRADAALRGKQGQG